MNFSRFTISLLYLKKNGAAELIYAILFTYNVKPPWCSYDSLKPIPVPNESMVYLVVHLLVSTLMGRWARVR